MFHIDQSKGQYACKARRDLEQDMAKMTDGTKQQLRALVTRTSTPYRMQRKMDEVDEVLNGVVLAYCLAHAPASAASSPASASWRKPAPSGTPGAARTLLLAPSALAPDHVVEPTAVWTCTNTGFLAKQSPKASTAAVTVAAPAGGHAEEKNAATMEPPGADVTPPQSVAVATAQPGTEASTTVGEPPLASASSSPALVASPALTGMPAAATATAGFNMLADAAIHESVPPNPERQISEQQFDISTELLGDRFLTVRVYADGSFVDVYPSHHSAAVFRAVLKRESQLDKKVVVKCFHQPPSNLEEAERTWRREVELIHRLSTSFVVTVLQYVQMSVLGTKRYCFIMEHLPMNLDQYVCSSVGSDGLAHGLTSTQVRNLTVQVLRIYHHLHSLDVVHRDCKPENILVSTTGAAPSLRLCDFSFSKDQTNQSTYMQTQVGTAANQRCWMSPEVAGVNAYDSTADAWSVGCVLYFLATGGQVPVQTQQQASDLSFTHRKISPVKAEEELLELLRQHHLDLKEPLQFDLIRRLLCIDPKHRLKLAPPKVDPEDPLDHLRVQHDQPPQALNHPACWSDARIMAFLVKLHEHMQNDSASRAVREFAHLLDTQDEFVPPTDWQTHSSVTYFWKRFLDHPMKASWQGPKSLLRCIRNVTTHMTTKSAHEAGSAHTYQELQESFVRQIITVFHQFIVKLWLLAHRFGRFTTGAQAELTDGREFAFYTDQEMNALYP
jgi:serine/threonine protein kinase